MLILSFFPSPTCCHFCLFQNVLGDNSENPLNTYFSIDVNEMKEFSLDLVGTLIPFFVVLENEKNLPFPDFCPLNRAFYFYLVHVKKVET